MARKYVQEYLANIDFSILSSFQILIGRSLVTFFDEASKKQVSRKLSFVPGLFWQFVDHRIGAIDNMRGLGGGNDFFVGYYFDRLQLQS